MVVAIIDIIIVIAIVENIGLVIVAAVIVGFGQKGANRRGFGVKMMLGVFAIAGVTVFIETALLVVVGGYFGGVGRE